MSTDDVTLATVCLCYDFDAVSGWIHGDGAADSPTKLSRGLFGVDVAAPRILDLHDRLGIPATWFTPGHTIDSFPEICGRVVDAGHDVQCHGWSHTDPSRYADAAAERADLERAVASIRDLTGSAPTGYRSPSWDLSPNTLDLLVDLGFEWDSSLMGGDFEPYRVRRFDGVDPDEAYGRGEPIDLVEFPVSWHRDDWPAFQFVPGRTGHLPNANEAAVFDLWYEQFAWMLENVDDGVYTLTMHPQVIGQAPRLGYLAELVDRFRAHDGVEFAVLDDLAGRY